MSSAYFTPARRATVQAAINGIGGVTATQNAAVMGTYDDMRLAETFLRTVIGDEGPSHDIDTILYMAWLIQNLRLELERRAAA